MRIPERPKIGNPSADGSTGHPDPEVVAAVFLDEFPWIQVLPEAEGKEFVRDFIRAALAAAELGRWEVLSQTIREWKATAAIHADPGLAERLSRPVEEDLGPVARRRGG